jgi:Zn finger protein HypA/HybF involved in hydrogenase expression
MDQLHKQEFTSLLANVPSNVVRAYLCSYVGLAVGAWLLVHPNTLSFCLSSTHFLTALRICFDILHPIVPHFSWCQCGHTIDDLGIHLLRCMCKSGRTIAHDMLQITVAIIALESEVHVHWEVSHLFPYHTWRRVGIVIMRDNFRTLVDVVIAKT